MARKSFSNQEQITPEKLDIKPEQSPVMEKPAKQYKNRVVRGQIIPGSLTLWSVRYEGIVEWPEGDKRIAAAGRDLRIIEIIER